MYIVWTMYLYLYLYVYAVCLKLFTRAGRHQVLKCRRFGFFVVYVVVGVELSNWLAPLIITLFARGDHVWAKYSGQMSEERN